MGTSDHHRCLFSASIEERNGSYVIVLPRGERELDGLQAGDACQVAILPASSDTEDAESANPAPSERGLDQPPVAEGDTRDVEIEDIGEQGDGITRVERGFVVIVPDTDPGERVTIEITNVQQNVAFADVIERLSYYA